MGGYRDDADAAIGHAVLPKISSTVRRRGGVGAIGLAILLAGCVGPTPATPTPAPPPRAASAWATPTPVAERPVPTAVVVVRVGNLQRPAAGPGLPGAPAGPGTSGGAAGQAGAAQTGAAAGGAAAGASAGASAAGAAAGEANASAAAGVAPELALDDPLVGLDAVGVPAGGAAVGGGPQRLIEPVQPQVVIVGAPLAAAAIARPTAVGPRVATPTPPVPSSVIALAQPVDRGSFVPPIVRNGQQKWGVGVYRDSNRILEVLQITQPGVILLMDPTVGWARRVRAQHPTAFIVGRRFLPDSEQRLDRPDERGAAFADHVAELAVPLKGVVDAWMSYNEVIGSTSSPAYAAYNRFQVAFARRLQYVHGIAAVAGNDGPGALLPEDYARHFAEAIHESEFFGLHTYPPSRAPLMRLDAEYYALRHRQIHTALERVGIRGKRMVITESGLAEGFQLQGITDEAYAEGMAWFTRELQRDPYMIGHATFGLFDATGSWTDHDITESALIKLMPRLLGRSS